MEVDPCWNIPNPTSLNVRRQLDRLFEQLPRDIPLVSALHTDLSQNALLPTLSRFMLHPSLTMRITTAFRPLLMDLCARWLDYDGQTWEKLTALGLLVEVHEELFSILSAFLQRFERGPLCALLKEKEAQEIDRASLHRVLLAYFRILRATPTLPRNLNWDLQCLLRLCAASNLDRGTRWLSVRCYSMQARMTERVRIRMEQDLLGELYDEDCPIVSGEDLSGNLEEVDGWILPVLESRRIHDYRNDLIDSSTYFDGDEESESSLTDVNLSSRIANVHGILLLRSRAHKSVLSSLVVTSPSILTLRQLAVNLSLRRPTLLTSAPSSGKTTLIHHLSQLVHPSSSNQVITIHLADTSLDPRSLIGSYVSSTTAAGTFEWKDGVLVTAMREGRWVVLKDIDRASNEVLGLVSPLAESLDDIKPIGSNAFLSLGNRGTVEAAESFALFATRSVDGGSPSGFSPPSFLGAQKWSEITMPENSPDDLRLLIDSKYPNIAGSVADGVIDIWLTVKRLRIVSSTRTVGIRDLEKFCGRVSQFLGNSKSSKRDPEGTNPSMISLFPHPSIREEIYLDARDVFFAAGATSKPALEQRRDIAFMIGEKLGLSEETCEWLLKRRSPAFEIEKDVDGRPLAVRAGRTSLDVKPPQRTGAAPPRPFSMHRQALRLISQIAACVSAVEPVLLTGETGTGKTSVISHLAFLVNRPLVSLNLSNQTESSDLIGGFRPVSARVSALELHQRFMELFQETFSVKKNERLLQNLRKSIANSKWKSAVKLWSETARTAVSKLRGRDDTEPVLQAGRMTDELDSSVPRKRRKLQGEKLKSSVTEWTSFQEDVRQFEVANILDKGKFAFHFAEGPLVKAIRSGSWVLLDEVNLASPETLECIASILQGPTSSIILTEQGSLEPVPRHPEFRLFACMNPATDVGKKDLPNNIRTRFTEIEVPPPDDDQEVLVSVIAQYIGHLAITDKQVISDIAELYTSLKQLAASGRIADGSNHRPHFSMRSLTRALTFTMDAVQTFGLRRALWEGFTMAFTMILDERSAETVLDMAHRALLSHVKNKAHFLAAQPPLPPGLTLDSHVQVGPFWLSSGPAEREEVPNYILTPSVQKKLMDLARIVMTKRYAVLIEGPTSSGKTSAIQYLARRTGHNFVRINNHEHTDIQEYLGSYVSDPKTGKLVFRDGLLVRALRRGDWIVLDELNLAPTDVLEALNRLLDDNRELVIPETQEVLKPHPNFMLFATQNPPGVYAGRKVLSRALRNRFLEVHFEDVPPTELEHILSERSSIAPSYANRIVSVFQELQKRRQVGRIFEGKEGFATLRDLFRWADRDAQGYQELAEAGYMLLAERTRREEDRFVVKEVIEKVMNVSISENSLYNMERLGDAGRYNGGIVWTRSTRRLFILLSLALRHNEPVLLVGETGTGKTSVCQLYATIEKKVLRSVNCHQNTEAADIIGGLRPVRQGTSFDQQVVQEAFKVLGLDVGGDQVDQMDAAQIISDRLRDVSNPDERNILVRAERALSATRGILAWQDGPLVTSMRHGDVFLLDEISLADDSVLERLNSVLELGRSIVLAEKGGDVSEDFDIIAHPAFKFVATMNPGGDFGKKELSPALRNRFTEIWVPPVMCHDELSEIVKHSWGHDELVQLTEPMLGFVEWLLSEVKDRTLVTLRDILSWVAFCTSSFQASALSAGELFIQGGEMALLDGLFSVTQLSGWSLNSLKAFLIRARSRLVDFAFPRGLRPPSPDLSISTEGGRFQIGGFSIPFGSQASQLNAFSLKAPTSLYNAFRLVRACQVSKPILLEGSPGVGKTSLVTALADATGQKLCRINLSEQTDLVDLFGSDLPVDGDASGVFAWRDAEFLRALKGGDWVLLDEMNLASQSVLEGLNAVFDHRATVYIPEIDGSFPRHPNFRVFAAQNPLNQGNGRKGLPKSFLNRFTKIYVEELSSNDLLLICQHLFPTLETSVLERMIGLNGRLQEEVAVKQRYGVAGAPWEFNLRDLIRWASLMTRPDGTYDEPWKYIVTVYGSRFRTASDKKVPLDMSMEVFGDIDIPRKVQPTFIDTSEVIICGSSCFKKGQLSSSCSVPRPFSPQSDRMDPALSALSQGWLVIITGTRSSGKTTFAFSLASACDRPMEVLYLGSSTDTSDLIGSFEQSGLDLQARHLLVEFLRVIDVAAAQARSEGFDDLCLLLELRDEAVTALRTRSFASLCAAVRSAQNSLRTDTTDPEFVTVFDAISQLHTDAKHSGPTFEWVDGPLIRAMQQGHWLLLDSANLCSPSVLDRLNSLCEANGYLVLTEKGISQEVIKPHPDFRLVMTVDPLRGEISRAMRNRGIELALDSSDSRSEVASTLQSDAMRLAMNRVCSRSNFDLSRRALYSAPRTPCHAEFISGIHDDSLSSRIMVVETLYRSLEPSYDLATALFAFNHSTPSDSRGLLRILDSCRGPRGTAFKEQLYISLQGSAALRSRLPRPELIKSLAIQHSPLNPYIAFPFINCPSDGESILAHISFLVLETYFMASLVQLELRKKNAPGDSPRPGRKDLECIFSFVESISSFAQQFVLTNRSETCNDLADVEMVLDITYYAHHILQAIGHSFINFSVLHAVSGWVLERLKTSSNHFSGIRDVARILHDKYALAFGTRIGEIWTSFYQARMPSRFQQLLPFLEKAHSDARKRAADLIAVVCSGAGVDGDVDVYIASIQMGISNYSDENDEETLQQSLMVENIWAVLISEMNQLACIFPFVDMISKRGTSDRISSFRQRISRISRVTKRVAYNLLLWKMEAGLDPLPELIRAHLEWHGDLWNNVDSLQNAGPSAVYSPVFLKSAVAASSIGGGLVDIEGRLMLLDDRINLALYECSAAGSRESLTLSFLLRSIELVLYAGFSVTEEPFCGHVTHVFDHRTSMLRMLDVLQHLSIKSLEPLLPALRMVANSSSETDLAQSVGRCWIALSQVLLSLYVPNVPVDPSEVRNSRKLFLESQIGWLEAQLRVYSSWERNRSGHRVNVFTDFLRRRIRRFQDCFDAEHVDHSIARQCDPSLLQSFWSEVRGFFQGFLSQDRLEQFVRESMQAKRDIAEQESLLQDSVTAFIERIRCTYAELEDLIPPIELSMMQLRFGLNVLRHSALLSRSSSINAMRKVLSFPSVRARHAAMQLASDDLVDVGFTTTEILLLRLSAASQGHDGHITDSEVLAIWSSYEQIVTMFDVGLAEKEERARQAESLYRSKQAKHETTDDVSEETQIRQLFPVFSGEDGESGLGSTAPADPSSAITTSLSLDFSRELLSVHLLLFCRSDSVARQEFTDTWHSTLMNIITCQKLDALSSFSNSVDDDSYGFQLKVLLRAKTELESADGGRTHSFYRDANVREARKAADIVKGIRRKLGGLIRQWPDQLVLQHLRDRCDSILSMNVNSSVAKMLGAIERLLIHTEDWEMFANRDNSLLEQRQSLTNLIVEWRKLELNGWKSILEAEAQDFCAKISEWWYRMYDVAVRGAMAASEDDNSGNLSRYLDSLTLLIEDFVRSSPLGQFKDRLKLISSFVTFTNRLACAEAPSQNALKRISLILSGIQRYYEQFTESVSSHLHEERASIEKDVQNLVKLATWRDVNVHALQQSAQRTHRQLYKRVRQFRELIRQPAIAYLQIDNSRPSVSGDIDEVLIAHDIEQHVSARGPPRTRKFIAILSTGVKHILDPSSSLATEELSQTIIAVQNGYANERPTRDLLPGDQKKWNSSLHARKRRSWIELLKELKRIGLSPNVKHETTEAHRSRRYLMEQPTIHMNDDTPLGFVLSKIDGYFYRCIGLLQGLLECSANHHPDIATREIQRGVSSFQNAFHIATSARSVISGTIGSWKSLRVTYRKFCELEDSQSKGIATAVVRDVICNVAIKTGGAIDASQELVDLAAEISNHAGDVTFIGADTPARFHGWISSAKNTLERLFELSKVAESSIIITEDDYRLIFEAVDSLRGLRSLLEDVSRQEPSLMRFCLPFCDWLDEALLSINPQDAVQITRAVRSDASASVNDIIDIFLVVGQDLVKIDEPARAETADNRSHLLHQYTSFLRVSQLLRTDNVTLRLHRIAENLSGLQPTAMLDCVRQLRPFIGAYLSFIDRYLIELAVWTKSLLKLTYVSGCLLRNVSTDGFCKPLEFDDAGGDQEGTIESAEGTGLGQGEGQEDVSNQIVHESEFEGIKSQDEDPKSKQQGDETGGAIDVDFDLGGDFEDANDDAFPEDQEGLNSDLDDEFANDALDGSNRVDEDFWDRESNDNTLSDECNEDSTGAGGESDVVAKEQQSTDTGMQNDQSRGDVQGEEKDGMDVSEPMPVDEEDECAEPEDSTQRTDDVDAVRPEEASTDCDIPEVEKGLDNLDVQSTYEEQQDITEDGDSDQKAKTDLDENALDAEDESGLGSRADVHAGGRDGTEDMGSEEAPVPFDGSSRDSLDGPVELPPASNTETWGSLSSNPSSSHNPDRSKMSSSNSDEKHPSSHGIRSEQALAAADDTIPNPHRSLGDALREVRRRLDEILTTSSDQPHEPFTSEQSAMEYAPNETSEEDMQALGPALGEETAKLDKLDLVEEEWESNVLPNGETIRQTRVDTNRQDFHDDREQESQEAKLEGSMDVDSQSANVDGDDRCTNQFNDLLPEGLESNQGLKVEVELVKWLRNGQPPQDAQRMWQLYDALTRNLSFSLCEQLRLILEPTRATRLMGDFRTGKRLNMKKIIPYIASNYTKDKIWLRRVRPSQREYQVLIALDDSRSMAETHSIHLAFQTLALVSKALNSLEVGDVAVASFGERLHIVHGFEDGPFVEQAGTKVLETFRFAQTVTDVRSLLESSVEVLTRARERRVSSSSSDLWQLEIIISDGICQDHEELRAILRKAEEERILAVFIIIDAQHSHVDQDDADETSRSRNSIVNMTQAMYRTLNGRFELHMQRYLDSFPFEFFVILKDVETLPDVLADTLRQFFQRISVS